MGGGPEYVVQGGSRILNATRVDQSAADNANVTSWTKANDFIIAININSGGKDTEAAQYLLRWRNKTDSGAFANVGAATEINYNATTDLVNGAGIAVGGRKCDSQGGDTWQSGEEVEGASLCDSIDLPDEYETEIHFALDCSGATDLKEYEFELWDSTLGVTRGTCGATITMAAGAAWPYWKVISITGQSGAGTDYQVELEIGDSAGGDFHLEGHCTNFPQDIRITDDDGTTLLDHFVEDLTADPIVVQVEVKDDLGSNRDIQIHYGKSGETTASNISNTFLFGDDFPGSSLDGTKWDTTGTPDSVTVSSSIVDIDAAAGWSGIKSDDTFGIYDIAIRGRVKYTSDKCQYGMSNVFPDMYTASDTMAYIEYDNTLNYRTRNDGGNTDTAGVSENSNYHIDEAKWKSGEVKLYRDGVLKGTHSTNVPNELLSIGMVGMVDHIYADWILIRKYNDPEPAFSSAGAEQTPAAGHPVMRRWSGIPGMQYLGRRAW